MLGYFGVSISHRNLARTAGSLTCVCDLFCVRIVYRQGTSVYSLIRRNFDRICTEFDSGEISGRVQSLLHTRHAPIHLVTSLHRAELGFLSASTLVLRH